MTKIDISMDTLMFLNNYTSMYNTDLSTVPIDIIINVLNIHDEPYTLIEYDEDKEVCLVEKQNMIFGNIIKSNKDCCICLEDFNTKNKIVKLECKHIFHIECLFETIKFKNSCPMCRRHIQIFLS